jgi:leader peptidase (prepilin peptidase)/N-methyltransferase
VAGALVGLGLKVSGQLRDGRYVPFGPFLAGGGLLLLLAGTDRALALMGW